MARPDPKKVTRMPGGRVRPSAPHPPGGPVPVEDLNPLVAARHQLHVAAQHLKLKPWLREILARPRRAITVAVPVRLEDGSYRVVEGHYVRHDAARGPALCGIRLHPGLTLDEVRAMALWTRWKCAMVDLPFGGAHAGIVCNPKEMTPVELERATRRWAVEALDPARDVAAPDLGADEQTMAWILDACAPAPGAPCGVTGGPPLLGGLPHRMEAVARACVLAVREACRERRLPLKGARVVVQGYGRLGAAAARQLRGLGAILVGISDTRGGVANAVSGIDPARADDRQRRRGSVAGLPDASRISNEELLALPCDILLLAASHGQVTAVNAGRVRAAVVAEAASGAVTPGADRILSAGGVLVVPDLLAGSGGVIASHAEWAREGAPSAGIGAGLESRIEEIVVRCFGEIARRSKDLKVDLRTAALILAVGRVAGTTMARGLNP